MAMVFCRGCGKEIHETATNCPSCGAPQSKAAAAGQAGNKSRVAAILLAFFLGGIGIHKFYLGKWGQGLAYLIFCWTLIPSIIAFVEFIIYLTLSDEEFARRYG